MNGYERSGSLSIDCIAQGRPSYSNGMATAVAILSDADEFVGTAVGGNVVVAAAVVVLDEATTIKEGDNVIADACNTASAGGVSGIECAEYTG